MEESFNWRDSAACTGMTEIFYDISGERPEAKTRREAIAKSFCDSCPVVDHCLREARENSEYGFWGGMSENERYLKFDIQLTHVKSRVRDEKKRLNELN